MIKIILKDSLSNVFGHIRTFWAMFQKTVLKSRLGNDGLNSEVISKKCGHCVIVTIGHGMRHYNFWQVVLGKNTNFGPMRSE